MPALQLPPPGQPPKLKWTAWILHWPSNQRRSWIRRQRPETLTSDLTWLLPIRPFITAQTREVQGRNPAMFDSRDFSCCA